MMNETTTDQAASAGNDVNDSNHTTAYEIFQLRTQLGLSRKQVQDATGLGASVVWRAEQVDKHVDPDNVAKICAFLCDVRDGVIKIEKTKKTSKSTKPAQASDQSAALRDAETARDAWLAQAQQLRSVVDEALAELDKQIDEARKMKRPQAPLKAVRAILVEHSTEH